MGYSYKPNDVQEFFDEHKIVSQMPPSFWWKAIPAASQMGFGVGKITCSAITVITPDKTKLIYKNLKNPDDMTS